jgi:hypothetical protein
LGARSKNTTSNVEKETMTYRAWPASPDVAMGGCSNSTGEDEEVEEASTSSSAREGWRRMEEDDHNGDTMYSLTFLSCTMKTNILMIVV